jgi:DNA invertase Pin-like site-specific DNA recombinase
MVQGGDSSDEEEDVEDKEEAPEVEVSRVSNHRIRRGVWEFKVHWKGMRSSDWVKDSDCFCERLIAEYLLTLGINTVYCVCRVSSKNQVGHNHVSLDAQAALLMNVAREQFGRQMRIKVIEINASAYRGIPREIQTLADICVDGDAVMIYRVDRLSRNIIKFLQLLEDMNDEGVRLYAADEQLWYDEQRLQFIQSILDAQKEAEVIGKRVKLAIEHRRKRGDEVINGAPYGYMRKTEKKTKRVLLRKNPHEQAVIRRIKDNCRSTSVMAGILNREGIKKRGKVWTSGMVKYIRQQIYR